MISAQMRTAFVAKENRYTSVEELICRGEVAGNSTLARKSRSALRVGVSLFDERIVLEVHPNPTAFDLQDAAVHFNLSRRSSEHHSRQLQRISQLRYDPILLQPPGSRRAPVHVEGFQAARLARRDAVGHEERC